MERENSTKNWKRILGILVSLVFSIIFISSGIFAWWDYDWESRNQLIVNSSLIDSDLVDFPLLVKLDSSMMNFSNTLDNGEDIRFVLENGTQLSFERIRHDKTAQVADYFVKIPNVSSTLDEVFYVYYNNLDAVDVVNKSDVWTNNFIGVWHLSEESWDGSIDEIKDSTLNQNNGRSYSGLDTTQIGPIYRVGDFDGVDHHALVDNDVSLDLSSQITINALINLESYNADGFMGVVGKGGWDVGEGYEILIRRAGAADENTIHWGSSDSRLVTTDVFPLNSWTYITTTLSGTTANIYLNETLDNTGTINALSNSGRPINIGRRDIVNNFAENFDGQIGEIRISSVERSPQWVRADSYSISNRLLSYGSSQELGSIFFGPITPEDAEILVGDSTDIEVIVDDLLFDSFSFYWNNRDYSYYDDNLVLMMNLDNVASLGENPSNVVDVSSYENNGYFQGDTVFDSFGKYGDSVYFDGNNDWIQVPDDSTLDSMNQFTFEAWVYKDFNDANPRGVASKRVGASSSRAWSIFSFTGQQIFFDVGSDRHSSGVALPGNRWVHLVVTFDGTAPGAQRKKFYYDGELVATTASSQTSISRQSTADLFIGTLNAGYGAGWEGYMDEIRIWDRTLDEEEVANSYNSSLNKIGENDWEFRTRKSNLDDGVYFYNATISNSSVSFSTPTRSLFVGSSIFFVPPTPDNDSFINADNISINVTKKNLGSNNIGIYLYNTSGLIGQFNSSTSPAFVTFTNLSFGEYQFNATLFANNGSVLETIETRTVTLLEEIGMDIQFVSPTPANGTVISGNSTLINTSLFLDNVTSLKEFSFNWLGDDYLFYNSSLVAHFNLDNNALIGDTSTIAKDVSLYNNDGTISGAGWITEGVYGSALNFNGGSDSLTMPSFSEFSGQNEVTIMGWVKQDVVSLDQYFLWADGNVLIQFGDTFNVNGAENLRVRWNLQGDWRNSHTVVNTLVTGEWNHWAFVFDSGDTRIYKNGIEVYTGSDTQTSISTNSPTYSFGTRTGSGLNGDIDEIRMYTRALNSSEIELHFNSNLRKVDLENWSYVLGLDNLSNGTYEYFARGVNNLDLTTQTPLRNFIVGSNVVNVEPVNGSKFFDTQIINLRLNSLEPLVSAQYYFNNDISNIFDMQSSNDLNWTANVSLTNIGINNITFVYNESITQQDSINTSVLILKNTSRSIEKRISSIGEDLFFVDIEIVNRINLSEDVTVYDFVDENNNAGSFNPFFDSSFNVFGLYNGTIYNWDLLVSPSTTNNLNYSITNTGSGYYWRRNFIVGLE